MSWACYYRHCLEFDEEDFADIQVGVGPVDSDDSSVTIINEGSNKNSFNGEAEAKNWAKDWQKLYQAQQLQEELHIVRRCLMERNPHTMQY